MVGRKLHIDIETYSDTDIFTAGSYKYFEDLNFEILMIAYAFDDDPVRIIDLAGGESLPFWLAPALRDPDVIKFAHNANFERNAFKKYGLDSPINQWYCTAVKSGYCGLPIGLDAVGKALNLGEKSKSTEGKALIRFFSCPVAPTKINGGRVRNYPEHAPEKWQRFKDYCIQDVEAEREIEKRLESYIIPERERLIYEVDQKINDRGILIDLNLAKNAIDIDLIYGDALKRRAVELTGLDNPNSPAQLKKWLSDQMQTEIKTLAKDNLTELIKLAGTGPAGELLKIRQRLSKTSIKKYAAMLCSAGPDSRARGLFQFYGAYRTGRWAGRIIQLQNLPKNKMSDLDVARQAVAAGSYDVITILYDNIPDILSQLIRTAFIPGLNKLFAVADYSAIEARIIAWLASEKWRMDIFATHGKIYEASAAAMYDVDISEVSKGSKLRDHGKVAELALGYGGGVGALVAMGAEKMGLDESTMKGIIKKWRLASPRIVAMWANFEECAIRATEIRNKTVISKFRNIEFYHDGKVLAIKLPSGRSLHYQNAVIGTGKFGGKSIRYKGPAADSGVWTWLDTYGGKLTENIVQAIARDALADALVRLDAHGWPVVMHVHDEAVVEVAEAPEEADDLTSIESLAAICEIMGESLDWAPGLILTADGYLTPYYKKD